MLGSSVARPIIRSRCRGADLGLAGLDLNVTATGDPNPSRRIDIAQPLTIDQIGLLAMLNNPDLKSERGTLDVARVALLQATLLPDPTANLVYVPSWLPAPAPPPRWRRTSWRS